MRAGRQACRRLFAAVKDAPARYGDDSSDGLPKIDSAHERLVLIRRAKAELEAQAREVAREQEDALKDREREEEESGKSKRGRKPKPVSAEVEAEAKANLTDPESRIMKKALYKIRGQIVEAVFGQIKDCRKLTRFLLRGLDKVKGEFELWSLTHNLLKLYRHGALSG
jgi:hypothetical protein